MSLFLDPMARKHQKVFVGIDPGNSGGVAGIGADGQLAFVFAMPETERDISDEFEKMKIYTCQVLIEKVHSMPKQGVRSVWTFSGNYHGVRMAMIAHGIPFDEVSPQMWQARLNIPKRDKTESKTEFKNRLKGKAQQLFPGVKITNAIADALLIAEYCRRQFS